MMYDRNGKLLVYNQPAYDVMLIMREIQPFDTLDFCDVLGITKEHISICEMDTCAEKKDCFSYRRDHTAGRHFSFLYRK